MVVLCPLHGRRCDPQQGNKIHSKKNIKRHLESCTRSTPNNSASILAASRNDNSLSTSDPGPAPAAAPPSPPPPAFECTDAFVVQDTGPQCLDVPDPPREDGLEDEPTRLKVSASLMEYEDLLRDKNVGTFPRAAALLVLRSALQNRACHLFWTANQEAAFFRRLCTHLKSGMVASALSASDRELCGSVLSDLMEDLDDDDVVPSPDDCSAPNRAVPVPTTAENMRRHHFNRTNSASTVRTLPLPEVVRIEGTKMGSVTIADGVCHAMLMPPQDHDMSAAHPRWGSLAVCSEVARAIDSFLPVPDHLDTTRSSVLAFLNIWSDGWDPNRLSKSNRGSVWSLTASITLFRLVGAGPVPFSVVNQLLCCGDEKEDHDKCFRKLLLEINSDFRTPEGKLKPHLASLRTTVGRRDSKDHIHFSMEDVTLCVALGAAPMDNPERRASACLLAGNSLSHAMFGGCLGPCNGKILHPKELGIEARQVLPWPSLPQRQD